MFSKIDSRMISNKNMLKRFSNLPLKYPIEMGKIQNLFDNVFYSLEVVKIKKTYKENNVYRCYIIFNRNWINDTESITDVVFNIYKTNDIVTKSHIIDALRKIGIEIEFESDFLRFENEKLDIFRIC